MTHRIPSIPALSMVLTLGACGDNGVSGTDTATTGTTTGTTTETTTTTGPGTTTAATTTTTGTTTEAPTTTEPGTTTEGAESTTIRVVHLSPDAPTVDIFANAGATAPVVDALALRNASTVTVPAGEYAFSITPDNRPIDQAVFEVPPQTYEAGKAYTLVALGKLADKSFDVIRLEDELAGIDATTVRLQVTHAASAATFAQVDVWTGPRADMLTLLLADFSFKDTRTADVPDADLVLGVDVNDNQIPDFTWDVPGATLTPVLGGLVHVFAYSDAQDLPSLQVVAADGPASQLDPDPDR
jgi:hypothetical protein